MERKYNFFCGAGSFAWMVALLLPLTHSCASWVGPLPRTPGSDGVRVEDPYAEIAAQPALGGGEYAMVPFEQDYRPTPPPKGYKPFYISHFGRHGARYNLGGYARMHTLLERAHAAEALNERGEDLYRRYEALYPATRQREGDLTWKGQRQQFGLARRMLAHYPAVFRDRQRVEAVSSTSNRSQLTMSAFCMELARQRPSLEIHQEYGEKFMAFMSAQSDRNPHNRAAMRLRFADGAEKAAYERDHRRVEAAIDTLGIALRIFRSPEAARSCCEGSLLSLAYDLYYLVASTQCIDYEEDFHDILSHEQWCSLWEAANHSFYAHFGPGTYFRGTQWASADTLLHEMLLDSERDWDSDVALRARFGHDVGVMALLSCLGVEGFSTQTDDPFAVKHLWQSWHFPMSVNLQWIFYRNARGSVLIRLQLNEEDIYLPVWEGYDLGQGPYYAWEDFRSYALARLAYAASILSSVQD